MIKNISLKKFKAFSNLEELEIKPLTILCGVNSGGKSSIIKSLLLLKQSYENSAALNEATLNGEYTTNGLMKNVVHNGKGDTFSISNRFIIQHHNKKFVYYSKQDLLTSKELGKITNLIAANVKAFHILVECSIKKVENIGVWDKNIISAYNVRIIPVSQNGVEKEKVAFGVRMTSVSGGKYKLELENFPAISGKRIYATLSKCTCYFSGMRLTNLFYEKQNKDEEMINLSDVLTNIYSVFRIVADQYKGIKYLGPLRENPQRQYTISQDYNASRSTGGDTPYAIIKNMTRKVDENIFPPLNDSDFEIKAPTDDKSMFEALKRWMEYFEIGNIDIDGQDETLKIKINSIDISDVGFGVSQVLPILTQGLLLQYEQTLLIEQPEIHLHPRMQMKMADFLLSLAETNHGVIVETHSDHIINRIVRRALEAKDDSVLNNIVIYFVDNIDNESKVVPIKIDRVNGIIDCPNEFFTQFASETSLIINAAVKNLIEKRNDK